MLINIDLQYMLRMFETTSIVVRDAVVEMELSSSSGRHRKVAQIFSLICRSCVS
jgi:hypothetical protein